MAADTRPWVVTAHAPEGQCDGIADQAAHLARALASQHPVQLVVTAERQLPGPSSVGGVFHQYSPATTSPLVTRWLDDVVAAGGTVIVTVHEYWPPSTGSPRRALRRWQLRRQLQRLARRAAAVIVTQEIGARELRASGVCGHTPISTVPVGSNIEVTAGSHPRDGGLVLFGQPAAMHAPVIAALARWRRTAPRPPALTWIGRSAAELRDAWRSSGGADDHVTLLGGAPGSAVSAVLARATIGLAPYSCGASARRSTLAALLQHGAPIVSLDGVATDSWLKGPFGLRAVPDGDPDAFVTAIESLWHDPQARDRLATEAVALHAQHMDWSRIGDAYASVMRMPEGTRA